MKILSVNAGSSSLKFSLFEMPAQKELVTGNFERIGVGESFYSIKLNGEKTKKEVELGSHSDAIKYLNEELISNGIITSLDDINGIGHRVVHGGSFYSKSTRIKKEVLENIEKLNHLAPLHNPANVMGIKAFMNELPNIPNIAVFDTAFHQTMEKEQYLYPVPYECYEKYGIRKYGFHGTSHKYIDQSISEYMGRNDLKVISCHIGSGSSICAINSHKVVDTSMGFTPLAGVMMGTRSGDIDASIIPFIMEKENKSIDEVMDILQNKSGFLGISGISSDSRDIEEKINEGNERAILTSDMNARRIANYIAIYNNILNGADVICFTAGLGEKDTEGRKEIIERIASLGIKLDKIANKEIFSTFGKITTEDSKIPVYVVPTNEELMIAIDTYEIIK